jgi:hypothetical protein
MKKPFLLIASAALAVFSAGIVRAQVVIAPSTPQIGSSNPVSAEPLVSRPTTKPCTVTLFTNQAFENFNSPTFPYTPPSNCPGPWAKVVFTADFTVVGSPQYDRTANLYIGQSLVYFGTTAEPSSINPAWHVERDVTDLSATLQTPQTTTVNLGNNMCCGLNGIPYMSAALEFYPANAANPAPRTPDIVIGVNNGTANTATLNTSADTVSQTLNLPTNVEKVYLDVTAQNQSDDEFYYLNVPNDQTSNLEEYGNTSYRETEVTIDGTPAGIAPAYPWIFTGGIDPYLWIPIPATQTLNLKAYRVDLTPFAGLLADGSTHTVAISEFNANNYFEVTANLLVYTDHGTQKVTGGVVENTLAAAPTPNIKENISVDPSTGYYVGTIFTGYTHSFTIKGYINTSHGRVETTISQNLNYAGNQEFNVDSSSATGTPETQNQQQLTTVDTFTTTKEGLIVSNSASHLAYPLNVNFFYGPNTQGVPVQNTAVDQAYKLSTVENNFGAPPFLTNTFEETKSQDDLNLSTFVPSNTKSSQTYQYNDNRGGCYSETLTSASNVLTGVTNGCRQNQQNQNQQ